MTNTRDQWQKMPPVTRSATSGDNCHKDKLQQLANQLDDVMSQAQFMANWVPDNRLNRHKIQEEFNILIAEIWDSQQQVNALIEPQNATGETKA